MDDLISLAVIVAVTAALMGYVRFCHRIAGDADDSVPTAATAPSGEAIAAPSRSEEKER